MSAASTTLLSSWNALVQRDPAATALIEAARNRVFTRAEIDRLAAEWVDRAPKDFHLRGARVAFALPNGADWLAVFIGFLRAGATPVPLDASEPIAHQQDLARQAGATYWLNGDTLRAVENAAPKRGSGACLIKLTSGSTGTPRALAFRDSEMLADGRQICATMDIRPEDVNLAIVPFGHSYGLGNLLIPLLAQGTAALCVSAPLPHAIAQDAARWKPTVFPAVPALLRVLTIADLPAGALESLRVVISAGSPLPPETAQSFYQRYHRVVHSFYGSSETGGISYDRDGEATLAGRGVGQPLEGVTLHFHPGQRFSVESAAVFTLGNRRRSSASHGLCRTADRGELNGFGELALLGRAGRMVKIAGRRLDLSELERALKQLPQIRDAFVISHPQRPDELAAALATPLPLEEARGALQRSLAPWKVPKRLIVFPEFPLTDRGKVNTRALRQELGAK